VYEALGLHLPILRDLITQYHAFMSMGSAISGEVDSSTYVIAVQSALPKVIKPTVKLSKALSTWPYPFKSKQTKPLTLATYLKVDEHQVAQLRNLAAGVKDPSRWAQTASRELAGVVGPFIDSYLTLYHQAFASLSKAAQTAEIHFLDPLPLVDNANADQEDTATRAMLPA
jgi:hypothetical protein